MSGPVDLDQLETALAAATPGPWRVDPIRLRTHRAEVRTVDVTLILADEVASADAAAIVAAVNAAPALIAELRALRAKVAAVEALASRMQDDAERWVGPGPSVEDMRTAAIVRNLRRALGSGS